MAFTIQFFLAVVAMTQAAMATGEITRVHARDLAGKGSAAQEPCTPGWFTSCGTLNKRYGDYVILAANIDDNSNDNSNINNSNVNDDNNLNLNENKNENENEIEIENNDSELHILFFPLLVNCSNLSF